MKKKIADFFTRVRIWIHWEVAVTYDKEYRCGNVQFSRISRGNKTTYEYPISEAEYLYDEPTAILRVYRGYVVNSEKAKKVIRK